MGKSSNRLPVLSSQKSRLRLRLPLLLLFFYILPTFLTSTVKAASSADDERTYYDILELNNEKPQDDSISLTDVKKAYRRLALLHHPDRNPGREEEAAVKFRDINEAYEILSNPVSRKEYDESLKSGRRRRRPSAQHHQGGSGGNDRYPYTKMRDPFAQFDDVFRNDPFFRDAFHDMNDLFAKTFQKEAASSTTKNHQKKKKQGWGMWLAEKFGVNIQVTTSTSGRDGSRSTNTWSRQGETQRGGGGGRERSSTYSSKSTRTVIENGRRVTIQSLEKDGNKIEEKYVGETLVERKINGDVDYVHQIAGGSSDEL
jgi:curved DNA-binding protein CbpA